MMGLPSLLLALSLPAAAPETPPPVPYVVTSVDTQLSPGPPWVVELEVKLRSLQPGWVDLPLISTTALIESGTLASGPAPVYVGVDGYHHLVTWLNGEATLRLRASVPGNGMGTQLPGLTLLSAPVRRVVSSDTSLHLELEGAVSDGSGLYLTGDTLALEGSLGEWRPPPPRAPQLEVQSQVALRVEDTSLEGWAELAGAVTGQALTQIHLDPGPGVEVLSLTGTEVAGWQQENGQVVVSFAAPVEKSFVLSVEWRGPLPAADAQKVPLPRVVEATSGQGWLSIRPDGSSWLIPGGLSEVEATSSRFLPEGLRPGEMGLAFRLMGPDPSLELALLRSTPLEMPAAVVSEAEFRAQHNCEGRLILKARYLVRNDRLPFLAMTLPPGWSMMSARVGGRVVSVAHSGDHTLLIPLERSVEGLKGLIAYPVDIDLQANTEEWARRGTKNLTLPGINIPIARAEWDLWLPPEFDVQVEGGSARQQEGPAASPESPIQLGYRRKQAPPPPPPPAPVLKQQDASVALFNEAWRLYQTNSWDDAASYVDEALKNDPTNISAQELKGNLDLLTQDSEVVTVESSQSRRVRDMARARSVDQSIAQAEAVQRADYALKTGELEKAKKELEQVVELSGQLAGLEQAESQDLKSLRWESEAALEKTRDALSRDREQDNLTREEDTKVGEDVGYGGNLMAAGVKENPEPVVTSRAQPVPESPPAKISFQERDLDGPPLPQTLPTPEDSSPGHSGKRLPTGISDKGKVSMSSTEIGTTPTSSTPAKPVVPPRNRTVQAASVELVLPYVGPHLHVEQQLIHSGEFMSVEVSYHRRRSK